MIEQQQQSSFVLTLNCSKINQNNENIKSKKYSTWLPGITMGASGARQPAGIPATERCLKEN